MKLGVVILGDHLTGDHAAPPAGEGGQIAPWQGGRIPNRTPAGVPAAPSPNLFRRPALNFFQAKSPGHIVSIAGMIFPQFLFHPVHIRNIVLIWTLMDTTCLRCAHFAARLAVAAK